MTSSGNSPPSDDSKKSDKERPGKKLLAEAEKYAGKKDDASRKKRFELLSQAALKEEPAAFANLGYIYSQGMGVPVDDQKAFHYFSMVADKHKSTDLYALFYTGSMLFQGKGTLPNLELSEKYLMEFLTNTQNKQSTNQLLQAQVDAHNFLGLIFLKNGKNQSAVNHFREAIEISKSADRERLNGKFCNPSEAFFNLGICYALGLGVQKNIEEAMENFKNAETFGFTEKMAREILNREVLNKIQKDYGFDVYNRRHKPLGLLVTQLEDINAIQKFAKHYQSSNKDYGRAIIFSALSAMFSPAKEIRRQNFLYIDDISKNDKQNSKIRNLAIVMKEVVLECRLNKLPKLQTDDAFLYLWIALNKAFTAPSIKNKFYGSKALENFKKEVTEKFKDSFISFMTTLPDHTTSIAKKKFEEMINKSKTLAEQPQHPDEKKSEPEPATRQQAVASPSQQVGDPVTYTYAPLPFGVTPHNTQESAPVISFKELFDSLNVRLEGFEASLNEEYRRSQRTDQAQAMSLTEFTKKANDHYENLRVALANVKEAPTLYNTLSLRLDVIKNQIDGIVNLKQSRLTPEAIELAKQKAILENQQLEIQQRIRKTENEVTPPNQLSDTIGDPVSSTASTRTASPVLNAIPLFTYQPLAPAHTFLSPPSIGEFIHKIKKFEDDVLEAKANPEFEKIKQLADQQGELATEMNKFPKKQLEDEGVIKKWAQIEKAFTSIRDPQKTAKSGYGPGYFKKVTAKSPNETVVSRDGTMLVQRGGKKPIT